jgi:hypothetical protein
MPTKPAKPGDRFGQRTIVRQLANDKHDNRRFETVCDNGHTAVLQFSYITRHKGCLKCGTSKPIKHPIIPGQRFGHRTVLEQAPYANTPHRMVRVQCDCGDISVIAFQNVYDGNSNQACRTCSQRIVHYGSVEEYEKQWALKEAAWREHAVAAAKEREAERVETTKRREERKARVLAMHATGLMQRDIADIMGISQGLVSKILKGER